MHDTNWDDLRYFLALCREGSATGAGRALSVNHTTVARRIRALEENIGTRLFDHSRNGYEMTQAAENMYEHARRMEEITQAIDREVFGQDAELKGPLKLTVSHDVAERLVIPRLPEFREAYPCIDLEILTTTGLVDLAAREADIALRLTAKPPEYLIGRQVLPMRHGVYGSPDYLKKANGQARVILFRGESAPPEWVQQHFPDAQVAMRVDDVSTMAQAVGNHMGLARMPCYVGDTVPAVRRLDLKLTPSIWGIWILSHVDLRSTARVRVAREFLIDVLEQQRALLLGERSRYFETS
ncbi:MAG: LysR family transcriptional regulator [Gammaproteobacteria bacterium]|nr:LysR family transcriptional regulator [Gammaproteobacteria bacterium]